MTVSADPRTCSFQFNPVGTASFTSSCDIAKAALAKGGTPYSNAGVGAGMSATIRVGNIEIASFEGAGLDAEAASAQAARFNGELQAALATAGYPLKANPDAVNTPMLLVLLTLLVIYVTMVYGPIAAWLVELFPTHIRYTSMSLPYHIGNGWFGGFLPTTAFAMVAATGDIYYGLWYPIVIALMTFVIGTLFLRDTKDVDIT